MEWKVKVGEQEYIAKTIDELQAWYREGRVRSDSYVYHPVLERWMYARELEELKPITTATQSPPVVRVERKTSPITWGCLILIILAALGSIPALLTNGSSSSQAPARPTSPEEREAIRKREADVAKREDPKWLASKAGRLCAKHPIWSVDDCETIAGGKISMGMTKEQVITAWGKPERVNTTSVRTGSKHEQWVYHDGNSYVYFDNELMTSVQQSQ